ncbi:arsenite efflux ATP-binding protein ArsA [Cyanobacterium stanieri PCC 7202]|uniref:Arsenite efflux ATP-binding protein ArsA n=1 Tax=Cyanobacterium stanieri (strain ATCC 29140 / PCC 7202) TaxID=292563 RepID=K9YJA9_CYASC|nr:arsenite efflux ATP-binding protein ArsA [Cyanobacterium stanieri PCC 7202]
MAFILTFLGKGGVGSTTMAIASAHLYAQQGKKVLLAVQDSSPCFAMLLGKDVGKEITEIAPNLNAIRLHSSRLLEDSWEQVKDLEKKYLRSPILKNIYGSELSLLPGMDEALILNYIREQDPQYDVIIFDSKNALSCLRMFGIPDTLSWYFRRMRNILENSDIVKGLSPFIQPVSSAILNVSWSADNFASQPSNEANELLENGKKAVHNPSRVASFLVTNDQPSAIASALYSWGSAQQIGLTVGGVLLNQSTNTPEITAKFHPLTINPIPQVSPQDWDSIIALLPDFQENACKAPQPLQIDSNNREVRVFLPGFDKKQVKLSQSGPEITIEAGDQRRNIFLPPPLKGQSVKGAKFQDKYLIINL